MKVERYPVGLVQKIHTEIADELPLGPLFSVSITCVGWSVTSRLPT
jgi:hypothetical protein